MAKFKVRHLRRKDDLFFFEPTVAMKLKGFYPEPLGRDYAEAIKRTEHLNAEWDIDRKKETEAPKEERSRRGTIAWLIEKHKKSQAYQKRPKHTKREFDYYTGLLIKTREKLAASIERKHIRELYENMITKKGYTKDKANRVVKWLRFLLSQAIEEGLRTDNPAFNLTLEHNAPRSEIWSHEDVAAFVQKATDMKRPSIGLAVMLAYDTGQRQGDILRLCWNQFDGNKIHVKQGKTGARVAVPIMDDMKSILASTTRGKSTQVVVSEATNAPYKSDDFRHHFREIANACGFKEKQFLDLRRSSIVRLSKAGCTTQLISSISGHSIQSVDKMMRIYNPPTSEQAEIAISFLEAYMGRRKNAV